MITLCDGPVKGTYMVKRAPLYLRATKTRANDRDVLDQPDDLPRSYEAIYVYRRIGEVGNVHLSMSNRRNSGFYARAEYEYIPDVDGEQLRDNTAWQAWVAKQTSEVADA